MVQDEILVIRLLLSLKALDDMKRRLEKTNG